MNANTNANRERREGGRDRRHIVQHQQQYKRDNFTFPHICLVRLLCCLHTSPTLVGRWFFNLAPPSTLIFLISVCLLDMIVGGVCLCPPLGLWDPLFFLSRLHLFFSLSSKKMQRRCGRCVCKSRKGEWSWDTWVEHDPRTVQRANSEIVLVSFPFVFPPRQKKEVESTVMWYELMLMLYMYCTAPYHIVKARQKKDNWDVASETMML